jgi:Spondin_N
MRNTAQSNSGESAMKSLVFAAAIATIALMSPASAAESVKYKVQVDATWTAKSHPLDYPEDAHFSGIIGTTHNAKYRIFQDGGVPTAGLEKLSEEGKHSPLDSEIKGAIESGSAGVLFESDPLFEFPGQLTATFIADEAHPNVSAVMMVAPSPDWFTGVSNVALRKNGKWVEKITLKLWAYDAGTDSGTTYHAPDADTQPRQSTRINASLHFLGKDGLKPVGTITFVRVDKTAAK